MTIASVEVHDEEILEATVNIPTPALVVLGDIVTSNLHRLAAYVNRHRLSVRPHTKTHKSLELARRQLDAGATGLTTAKVGEAEVMAEVSDDLLLAYPIVDPTRAQRLARLAVKRDIRVAVDSAQAVENLASAARRDAITIGLLVDLDVGLGRTGVQTPTTALQLARTIDQTRGVRLDGLFCYPGHVWDCPDEQQRPMDQIAATLDETLEGWKRSGLDAKIVSGGSTPTLYQSHLIPSLTEVRPGTYIYNDMNTVRGGFCSLSQCAVRLIGTIVSDAKAGQVVLDAGSKSLTSDRCIPEPESGFGFLPLYPDASITRLSEEHGQVNVSRCPTLPKVGQRVSVIPNHVCPCINLCESVWWWERDRSPKPVRVDARGRVV